MSFLFHLKTLLAGKLVAGAAAGAMVVAGVAVASNDSVSFLAASESEELGAEDDEEEEEEIEEEDDRDDAEDESDDGDEDTDESDDDADEDGDDDGDDDGDNGAAEEVTEVDTEDDLEVATDEDDGGRSETAKAVHRALTATDDSEGLTPEDEGLTPEDEGFGQRVAENARDRGGHGAAVSEAARGANEQRRGAGGSDDGEVSSSNSGARDTAPGRSNRPSWAGSPGGPNR